MPSENAYGKATYAVNLFDGYTSSEPYRLTIIVESINDPPSFKMTADSINIPEDYGEIIIEDWATEISAGENELDDSIQFFKRRFINPKETLAFRTEPEVFVNNSTATLKFETEENSYGSAIYLFWVIDGHNESTNVKSFTINVTPVNDPPEISHISNQLFYNYEKIIINFQVSDIDNSMDEITLSGSSSNSQLIPDAAIKLTKNDDNCQAIINHNPLNIGNTTITLTAKDSQGDTTSTSFTLQIVYPDMDGNEIIDENDVKLVLKILTNVKIEHDGLEEQDWKAFKLDAPIFMLKTIVEQMKKNP
jgi:hypothetical protein